MVSFDARRRGSDELTIEVGGDVDWDAVLTLEPQWESVIDEGELSDVTIDLARVRFIDSTGISLLTSAADRIRDRGARLRIVKPEPQVFRIFEVVGIHDMLPFVDAA